ncbi:hypothetical protein [uncultured Amphritea sp.]|uniref:hypothetical protein n=1 Tax=uncultured Amphritea sp. TaxID=981605 RepID=UPI00263639E9|nr:hypothetical protein [uncultured Amphritea sp.]
MKEVLADNAMPAAQKVSSFLSYLTGAGLFVGDAIHWMDNHAGAAGVMLGIATFAVNFYFQRKRSKEG